jgi:hypothetical protein
VGDRDAIEFLGPPDDGWRIEVVERWEDLDDDTIDELQDIAGDETGAQRGFETVLRALGPYLRIVPLTDDVITQYDKQAYGRESVSAAIAERGSYRT